MTESINPRTVAQSLETAIEGTKAQAILNALPQGRRDQLMEALVRLGAKDRDATIEKFMGMTEGSAQQLIDDAISAGGKASATYTVQRGDSLSKIAKAHGLSLNAVIKANPQISNPDLIYPDQRINLPNN